MTCYITPNVTSRRRERNDANESRRNELLPLCFHVLSWNLELSSGSTCCIIAPRPDAVTAHICPLESFYVLCVCVAQRMMMTVVTLCFLYGIVQMKGKDKKKKR